MEAVQRQDQPGAETYVGRTTYQNTQVPDAGGGSRPMNAQEFAALLPMRDRVVPMCIPETFSSVLAPADPATGSNDPFYGDTRDIKDCRDRRVRTRERCRVTCRQGFEAPVPQSGYTPERVPNPDCDCYNEVYYVVRADGTLAPTYSTDKTNTDATHFDYSWQGTQHYPSSRA